MSNSNSFLATRNHNTSYQDRKNNNRNKSNSNITNGNSSNNYGNRNEKSGNRNHHNYNQNSGNGNSNSNFNNNGNSFNQGNSYSNNFNGNGYSNRGQNNLNNINNLNNAANSNINNFNNSSSINNSKNQFAKETCVLCGKNGHIGETCRLNLTCGKCNMKGHTDDVCRQHLLCTRCGRKGHLADICYATNPKRITLSNMAIGRHDRLPRWTVKLNGIALQAILDSGAEFSVISQATVERLKIPINISNDAVETSTGEICPVNITEQVEVTFEAIPAKLNLNVTNLKAADLLLGYDWFNQTKVILDPANDEVILPKRIVKPNLVNYIQDYYDMDDENENELECSLNMLSLEHEDIGSEYFDDYAFFDNKELDISKLSPSSKISEDIEKDFMKLLDENKRIFATSIEELGCCKNVKFRVETTSDEPIHNTPYRQSPPLAKISEEELDALFKAGFIRRGSAGTWTSSGYTIKQNGKYRFVVNYKDVNERTKPLKHPIGRIDDLLDSFQGAFIFSTVDLRKGFHQLEIEESDKYKLGFITRNGVWEYNRLPFGVTNGPTFFSAVMQNILGDLPYVKIYIDDFSIASKSEDEHLQHIKTVFKRLEEHNLKLNPEKCVFFARSIKILGFIIDQNGIKMDPEKVEAIKNRKEPVNLKDLQSFLGLANFYRKFIKDYAKITAPLHRLTANQQKWHWSTECKEAFIKLKELIVSYPILRLPNYDLPFFIYCDASFISLGAMLGQVCPKTSLEYTCAYASKILKDNERHLCIAELETLSVIWSIQLWHNYLQLGEFTVYTDCAAVKWLMNLKNPSSKLLKYQLYISHLKFKILHRPGKANGVADALSRPVLLSHPVLYSNHLSIEEASVKTLDPYEDACLLSYLKNRRHIPGASRKQVKRIEKHAPFFKLNDDDTILARLNSNDEFDITIPKPEHRQEIVLKEHELGHPKGEKIEQSIRSKKIMWKNMRKFIDDLISLCDICIKHEKIKATNNPAMALNIDNIFDRWGIDITGGLPVTKEGYHAFLTVVEYLTKFAWAFPLKTIVQLKELIEQTHTAAVNNITKAQVKQVNTQNRQSNSSNEPLAIGTTVFLKDCRLIKGKMEPFCEGPYKISGRNIDSGNYIVETLDGQQLKCSHPRWKLKPTSNHEKLFCLKEEMKIAPIDKETILPKEEPFSKQENKIINTKSVGKTNCSHQTDNEVQDKQGAISTENIGKQNEYEILHVQPVGRGFRYNIKWPDGKMKWIPGQQIDQKILSDYLKKKVASTQKTILSANLLITIIIIFGLLLNTISAVRIDDEFLHCQTTGLNRIIKPNPDCAHPKELKKALAKHNSLLDEILHKEKLPSDILLLSRNKYYMNEIGYQCFKTIRTTYLNETWLFKTSRSDNKEIVHLTRHQCQEMVETQYCDRNKMTCNNDGCWYYAKPIEVYYYNWDFKIETTECSFIKKQVIAQFEDSQLYFSPANECRAKNLECKLHDSIIIWQNSSKSDCLLTNIHNGTNYTLSQNSYFDQHNILYSIIDNLSFQLTSTFYECNLRLFKTTTDAYVLFKNDPESARFNEIENSNEKISFNRQHDINNILLAETDNNKQQEWYKEQEKIHQENFIKCNNFKSNIDRISLLDDTINSITDPNGNTIHTYTLDGIVYIPYCTSIGNIYIEQDTDCHQNLKIKYEIMSPNRTGFSIYPGKILENRTGYLTTNNIIRDHSPIVQCDLIRTNQLIPSNQQMIIRRQRKTTVMDTSHLIIHDIAQSTHVHAEMNFPHHKEIIMNYQQEDIKIEFQQNQNVMNEEFRFYTIPYDQHVSEMQFKSKTSEEITDLKSKVVDYIATSTLVTSIIGGLTTIFIIYVCFKVLLILIENCSRNPQIGMQNLTNQPNRIQIDLEHQKLMREYELRRIEPSKF